MTDDVIDLGKSKTKEMIDFLKPERDLNESDTEYIEKKVESMVDILGPMLLDAVEQEIIRMYVSLTDARRNNYPDVGEIVKDIQVSIGEYLSTINFAAETEIQKSNTSNDSRMPAYKLRVHDMLRKAKINDIPISDQVLEDVCKYFPEEVSMYRTK